MLSTVARSRLRQAASLIARAGRLTAFFMVGVAQGLLLIAGSECGLMPLLWPFRAGRAGCAVAHLALGFVGRFAARWAKPIGAGQEITAASTIRVRIVFVIS